MVGQVVSWGDTVVVIPTVGGRRAMVCRLKEELRCECKGALILSREHEANTEPSVDFPAVIDMGLRTGREWILQLEDDVELCPAFGLRFISDIAGLVDDEMAAMTLFSRRAIDEQLLEDDIRWYSVPGKRHCMNQAVMLRSGIMSGFAEWAPTWYKAHPEHKHAADLLLGEWLSRSGIKMWVRVPSLVQHRVGPSTLGPRSRCRISKTFEIAWRSRVA